MCERLLSNLLFGTRFVTIWIAHGGLLLICRIVAPSTLSSASWSSLLPLGSVVAIVALGQMLVIMMGGIDLSMAARISLLANVLVGVSKGSDDKLAEAIVIVFVVAVVIGLVNGLLVAVLDLNPLIVTLSTGLILLGINTEYRAGIANSTTVPDSLSDVRLRQDVRGSARRSGSSSASRSSSASSCDRPPPVAASRRSAPTGEPPGWPASASGST